jgi:NADP-dependent 3-hydroxy acid dehydrogenase YdfG
MGNAEIAAKALQGRVAIVTGAAKGIGAGIALALLGRGEVHNEIKLRVMPW